MKKPCWSILPIVSLGSRSDPFKYFLWRLQRHMENRKLVLKPPKNNNNKKPGSVLLAVVEVYAESLSLLLSREFTETLLTHCIGWSITRWEMMKGLRKRTVAVFFWAIVWIHEWLMCSVLAEQPILCAPLWSLGYAKTCRTELSLPGPRVLWLGSMSPWRCILFCTLESLG